MRKDLEEALVAKYPKLYKDYYAPKDNNYTRMSDGFSCGDGWYKVIDETSQKLMDVISTLPEKEQEGYRIFQVKQKFGMLRMSFGFGTLAFTTEVNDKLYKITSNAENMSCKICESCGKEGHIRKNGHWLVAMCDICAMLK